MTKQLISLAATALVLSAAAAVVAVDGKEKQPNKVTSKELGEKERYLIYGSTDKPVYRAEEKVYLRAVILNGADNTPLKNGNIHVNVKITDSKGGIVFQSNGYSQDSTAGIVWDIPAGQAGGQYTAAFSSIHKGIPETKRSFEIRAYRAPRLKSQIEFAREGYGPGDTATASVKVTRAEGGIPKNAKITAIARVDGKEVFRKDNLSVNDNGTCSVDFSLPGKIIVGDGTLSFVIEDGGVAETAGKTIPILLPTMNITFYPEGGELVSGLPCRVYVQANRPDGKPADIEGGIFDPLASAAQKTLAAIKTIHEGRGIIEFTPNAAFNYELALSKPSGITQTFELPKVKKSGATLRARKEVYPFDGKITVAVNSTADSNAGKVTVCKREIELDSQPVEPGKNVELELDPKDSEGVLIVTVWDKNGIPLAERLVYRQPKFTVNVAMKMPDKPCVPGDKVKLEILTTDENGRPVEAVVGLTVTDDAVLEMVEKREQPPRLPVMVYLENEVIDLADAQVYLDSKNPKSAPAVDLLLGTQGWRRFILVNYNQIKSKYPEAAKRVLAENIMMPMPMGAPRVGNVMFFDGEEKGMDMDGRARLEQPKGVVRKELRQKAAKILPQIMEAAQPLPEVRKNEEMMMDIVAEEHMKPIPPMVVIREYSHQTRPNRKPNDRVDFTETLYWNAGLRTGARDGKATIEFGLSDSVTSFRVMADAFGNNGAIGTGDTMLKSVEPFYIEPKMPLTATVGDVIELPVALINSTDENFATASLLVRGEGLDIVQAENGKLDAGKRERRIVKITPMKPGTYKLTVSAAAGSFADTVTKTLTVSPKGFPVAVNGGGLIDAQHPGAFRTVIPAEIEPASMKVKAILYPTPLANMEEALNALLRQPCGCFEQTSSTNYPLVMAQQYFISHHGIAPEKIAKARELLNQGYKMLTGFECKQKGYEWFGGDPGHEALSAYGLMEFADMAKVMPVDSDMVARTREWLLSKRDGSGGFKRNERALDSFGRAPVPTTNAYILWALLESGEDPKKMSAEIAAVKKEALASKDSYLIALAANILYISGDRDAAGTLAGKLVKAVDKDGKVTGGGTSITCSGGDSLALETTSLALLAWLRDDAKWAATIENSMKWLFEQCKAGRFGTTQSTILALKAINAYDKARAKPLAAGSVQLKIDGQPFGKPVAFSTDTKGAVELPDFAAIMTPGEHSLELVMDGGSRMPYSIEISYFSPTPATSPECLLKLETGLSSNEIREGEPLELTATITVGKEDASMPVAIIGLPAGLEPRYDQLKELVGAKRIDAYEVIGRDLVLYWRGLKAGEVRSVPVSLTASIPGTYTGPASRVYLYYTDEYKFWIPGMKVKISPR